MTLKNLETAYAEIPTSGGAFEVRGLSLAELTALAERHREPVLRVLGQYMRPDENEPLTAKDSKLAALDLVNALVEIAPALIAEIIAIAADEPESVQVAAGLSIDVQIIALSEIWRLSTTGLARDRAIHALAVGVLGNFWTIEKQKMARA